MSHREDTRRKQPEPEVEHEHDESLLAELEESVRQASRAASSLGSCLTEAEDNLSAEELRSELESARAELDSVRADRDELVERMVEAEQQAARVMSLYVATHQLHATLKPEDVYAAIGEIAVDLLGAECYSLLLRDETEDHWRVALAEGLEETAATGFGGSVYGGGDSQVDATLADGLLRIGEGEDSPSLAAVPLRVEDGTIGVLVIFKVFGHKDWSLNQDRELLDLLSAHAGSALLAAESYSTTDRRLKTLRDLVSLLPST
jgi:GAF domain-containing protein